ncbi:PIG-L family deacetylase [Streptomyces bauhiniae]|uniref:PIG-L family deacetylase n=1 Tax=Streptomyces bauhiniae TaxID=2340725 RepID=UPI00339ECF7B
MTGRRRNPNLLFVCAPCRSQLAAGRSSPACLEGARVRVVVAHFDDEALFCGGLLSGTGPVMADLRVAVVTGVETTSAPREITVPLPQEVERRRRRLAAFDAVCWSLGARPSQLHLANLSQTATRMDRDYQERVEAMRVLLRQAGTLEDADVVITHGFAGEYGHPQHHAVHDAVISSVGTTRPAAVWTFGRPGRAHFTYRHDARAKARLLEHYRNQRIDGTDWRPETDARMRLWTGPQEWYHAWSVINGRHPQP